MKRLVHEGELLLAPYSDGYYYRAVVKKVNMFEAEVLVSFIDCGDEIAVEITKCREVNESLAEVRQYYFVLESCFKRNLLNDLVSWCSQAYPVLSVEFLDLGIDPNIEISENAFKTLQKACDCYYFIMHIVSKFVLKLVCLG